jgi:2-oxo-4-hydroxy-4-carboxy-5-ureidoimidazoline decarboxylase
MESWQRLDDAPPSEARHLLLTCCHSRAWAHAMEMRRPFGSHAALLDAARQEWFALAPDDWLDAFQAHPRIGDRESLRARFGTSGDMSAAEQSGLDAAGGDVLDALARANSDYEQKFGFIFIVCAAGKRADEMLAILRDRMKNDRATELRVAAEEQARITALRLARLRDPPSPARTARRPA